MVKSWIECFLKLLMFTTLSLEGRAFERFLYNRKSCDTLIPIHSSSRSSPDPGKIPLIFPSSLPIEFAFSTGDQYAPGRDLFITITIIKDLEGFMLQARKNNQLGELLGSFFETPSMVDRITCTGGENAPFNTVLDDESPTLLENMTIRWTPPERNEGNVLFRLSILIGNEYEIYEKTLSPSELPPLTAELCGVEQHCFRLCPIGYDTCSFAEAVMSAVLKNNTNNDRVNITIGVKTYVLQDSLQGYAAIGLTKDKHKFSEMDIDVCYREGGEIKYSHLFLDEYKEKPARHLSQDIPIEKTFIDNRTIWCIISRPINSTSDASAMNLLEPTYFYFFTGYKDNEGFHMPRKLNMKRTRKRINYFKDKPFDILRTVGRSSKLAATSFTLVTQFLILFGVRFLA